VELKSFEMELILSRHSIIIPCAPWREDSRSPDRFVTVGVGRRDS
jgi:hypothetical protein